MLILAEFIYFYLSNSCTESLRDTLSKRFWICKIIETPLKLASNISLIPIGKPLPPLGNQCSATLYSVDECNNGILRVCLVEPWL